jgi:hypothetical protein
MMYIIVGGIPYMNTASAKAKGRRLQQYIVKKILELFPELTQKDVRSAPMGVPGADVQLSERASKVFPYSVESKNTEKLELWKSLEQSTGDNRDLTPLLVFKRNNSEVYCAMKLEDFLGLLGGKDGRQGT